MTKVAFRRSIGVYIGEHELTVTRVAHTPIGPVELATQSQKYTPETLDEALSTLLGTFRKGSRSITDLVLIGLPLVRVFFGSKELKPSEQDVKPATLLVELFQSTNINYDDMEIDLVKRSNGKQTLARVITCRRSYISSLMEILKKQGVRTQRAEPASEALIRVVERQHRAPRKSKSVIRVFLGATQGMAVVVCHGQPAAWRLFPLPAGGETASIRSLVKSIALINNYEPLVPTPDALMIHGRPDLKEALGAPEFLESLPLSPQYFTEPGYDPRTIAYGLALANQNDEEGFDLFRKLKSRPPFWHVIPFGDIILQLGALACLTMYLYSQHDSVRMTYQHTMAETAEHAWMNKVDDAKLDKEKKELQQRVEAIHQFLDTRILWSAYSWNMSALLPETLMLRSFTGICEYEGGAKAAKAKRSLQFSLAAPIAQGTAMPREINEYLDLLRSDPLLGRDFPTIEMSDLRWAKAGAGNANMAEFTISCTPKIDKKPKAPEH